MNRFPAWKYALIGFTIAAALLYTLPNFFGESPAVQVSSGRTTVKVDALLLERIESALKAAGIRSTGMVLEPSGLRARFADGDTQLKAKDLIEKALNGQIATVYDVVDDKITAGRVYLEAPALMAQLGVA